MSDLWLVRGRLITPRGIVDGAVRISGERIAAIRPRAPKGVRAINLRGRYLAPGFIDLHVWGEPRLVAQAAVRSGTTGFLTALGPASSARLIRQVRDRAGATGSVGAECLGLHLEGPFVNPARAGALPKRWMRTPTVRELEQLHRNSRGRIRLMTVAPELPRALEAIARCRRHGIVTSLGHSQADAPRALQAVDAGATAVTHVFNAMQPFHHRQPVLLDVALTDPRLTTMVIFDEVHVSPHAFRLLVRAKGVEHVALVTDSIRHQGWDVIKRHGAYYTRAGVLAGSDLTMLGAVRNAVLAGGVSLVDAVHMASRVPARLLGLGRARGTLEMGKRADLLAFDRTFQVFATMVGGKILHQGRT